MEYVESAAVAALERTKMAAAVSRNIHSTTLECEGCEKMTAYLLLKPEINN